MNIIAQVRHEDGYYYEQVVLRVQDETEHRYSGWTGLGTTELQRVSATRLEGPYVKTLDEKKEGNSHVQPIY